MRHKNYLKRDPIKNYFPLPNVIFSLGLYPGEIAVYSYLLHVENRHNYQAYPSYRTIGSAVNLSQNTVRKHVAGLESKRLIYTEPTDILTKTGRKQNGSLLYTIRPIQEAVDHHYQRQLTQLEVLAVKQRAVKKLEELDRKRSAGNAIDKAATNDATQARAT